MRKLKLNVEELTVQSFATAGARGVRGTARAHQDTAAGGDTAYVVDPAADTAFVEDTGDGVCLTCELSCGTRGC